MYTPNAFSYNCIWVIVMHIFLAAAVLPAIVSLYKGWCDRLGGDVVFGKVVLDIYMLSAG